MGREVRMVPVGWEHPRDARGRYVPLLAGPFEERVARWDEEKEMWGRGLRRSWKNYPSSEFVPHDKACTFEEWNDERPRAEDYMPTFAPGSATHLMMYATCSEGTPISPAFETPEELARWLADTGASAMGSMTATYEQWLAVCRGGWAPSAVVAKGRFMSGVEASEHLSSARGARGGEK